MPSTTNRNQRGGSPQRRARKLWLLSSGAGFGGDGEKVQCSFGCGTWLSFETVTVDRFPLAGINGGTYKRGNIRPACARCNYADGGRLGNTRKLAQVICYVEELLPMDLDTEHYRKRDLIEEIVAAARQWHADSDHKARVRLRAAVLAADGVQADDVFSDERSRGYDEGMVAEREVHFG